MKIKARIIEKESLEQMFNIREKFHVFTKGKMDWELIEIDEVIEGLLDDDVMVFTQKFGEVGEKDLEKLTQYKKRKGEK